VFSLLTDKDELMSYKQCSLFGLFDSALSIGFVPLRDCNLSFTKL